MSEKITLWTLQHIEAYKMLEKNGVLHANEQHLFCEDDLRYAYDWLTEQMKKRVDLPPDGVSYPIWAWYKWEGKHKRCDLRCGGYAKRGTPMVQMEIQIDSDRLLLSDFDRWVNVLNKAYIVEDESEWDRMDKELERLGTDSYYLFTEPVTDTRLLPLKEKIMDTWQTVFQLDTHMESWDYPLDKRSVQATFWELRMEDVVKAEHFIAK